MRKYYRYILFIVICIFLTCCSKQNDDFAVVNDTAEVHEKQPEKETYWQKQFDVNGTNIAQIVINAKIGGMQADSLYEVLLSRRDLDEHYAEQTAEKLFYAYEKQDSDSEEEGFCYTGYRGNQSCECELEVYHSWISFKFSDYKNGLQYCPEGEWADVVPAYHYLVTENTSEISLKDAEEIADSFLGELDLDEYRLAEISDMYWEPKESVEEGFTVELYDGSISKDIWCEGYVLTYARDIRGTLQDVAGYWYTVPNGQVPLSLAYNTYLEEITLYVTDSGVIAAWASQLCNAEERSLEGQKIIDIETAKERFVRILTSDANRFSYAAVGGKLEFNRLDLVYYADAPNHISPVWKLSNYAKPYLESSEGDDEEEVYQQVILLDAVSGEEIDPLVSGFSMD